MTKKRLFIKQTPNTLASFDYCMEKGHEMLIKNESVKDFSVEICFNQNCVKLYLIEEVK